MNCKNYSYRILFATGTGIMIFLSILFLLPIGGSLRPLFTGNFLQKIVTVFTSPLIYRAAKFTFLQAFCSMLIAAIVGLPAAFFTARRTFLGRRLLLSLSSIPLCTPPLLIALAFVLFYGRNGIFNHIIMLVFGLIEPPAVFLYSFFGIVITQGLYNFPLFMRIVGNSWSRLPEDQETAARLLGASDIRIFFSITIPRLLPSIGAAALPVFLSCFFSFIIVLLFGGIGTTTLEVELYQAARTALDFPTAGIIALIESTIALLLTVIYAAVENKISTKTTETEQTYNRKTISGIALIPFALFMLFLLFFFFGPLCTLAVQSFVTNNGTLSTVAYRTLFYSLQFRQALINTCVTGLQTALLATTSGIFLALWSVKNERKQLLWIQVLGMLPMAVSGVVCGFGWMQIVSHGSVGILVCAQAAAASPYVMRIVRQPLLKIRSELYQSSLLLGADYAVTTGTVLLPICRRNIRSGFCFAFAVSAGDAVLPLVLGIPGYTNLALLLFRYAGSRRMAEAGACGIVLGIVTSVLFFIQDRNNE